ncbi:MAG: hypothetical protein J3K34DRAFT_420357 [Monoraphidium minutum]|nr:MAG: hypothetical protein J3K34DRAFT_420357 [Monoraphidium minutum]
MVLPTLGHACEGGAAPPEGALAAPRRRAAQARWRQVQRGGRRGPAEAACVPARGRVHWQGAWARERNRGAGQAAGAADAALTEQSKRACLTTSQGSASERFTPGPRAPTPLAGPGVRPLALWCCKGARRPAWPGAHAHSAAGRAWRVRARGYARARRVATWGCRTQAPLRAGRAALYSRQKKA